MIVLHELMGQAQFAHLIRTICFQKPAALVRKYFGIQNDNSIFKVAGFDGSVLDLSVHDINQNQKKKVAPLKKEVRQIKKRISDIEAAIGNYIKAIGTGTRITKRLETEIEKLEKDRNDLQVQYEELQRQINDAKSWNFDSEVIRRGLQDFRKIFNSLTAQEKSDALHCVLKDIVLHSDKLIMNIYELPEFKPGSQNRTEWLPR